MRALIGLAVLSLVLGGCANGYQQFYVSALSPAATVKPLPATSPPRFMVSTGNAQADVNELWAQGYLTVGYANFNGPLEAQANALAQAKQVGAEIVVISAQYASTVTGAIPITTTTPRTSYTSGNVNVMGSGGFASGTYSGTTTTYDSNTSYVPYAIQRYDQSAIFFAPAQKVGAGLMVGVISPELASQLGTERGLVIRSVRRGSPAFLADVLPGDVLQGIDGHPIYDQDTWQQTSRAAWGHAASYQLLRGTRRLTVTLSLNADGSWP